METISLHEHLRHSYGRGKGGQTSPLGRATQRTLAVYTIND
jgi:hypothetical protein